MHPYFTPDAIDRFWSNVDRSGGPDACWLWLAGRTSYGYGSIYLGGGRKNAKRIGAHVFSYILANGPFDPGSEICHHCDTPGCVNPAHLFIGSHAENMRDMREKGRASMPPRPTRVLRGEEAGRAKLSEDDVRTIRSTYIPVRASREGNNLQALAAKYGVTRQTILDIAKRKSWKHLA